MRFTIRDLDGTVEYMFNPVFRKVDFRDTPLMIIVAINMRRSWIALPINVTNFVIYLNGIGAFICGIQNETAAEPQSRLKIPTPLFTLHGGMQYKTCGTMCSGK
jgi:hypothetical protein